MKKFIFIATLIALGCPVLAEEIVDETPIQEIENTKAYTGINYNRQDSEKIGRQSWPTSALPATTSPTTCPPSSFRCACA